MLYYGMQNNKKTVKNKLSNFNKLSHRKADFKEIILTNFYKDLRRFKLSVAEDGFELSRLKCAI